MSRSGCASIWRRISPRVSSVELPSTKISSVGTPKSGTRSISSAMCPCSFRHAQTIETLDSSELARQRARDDPVGEREQVDQRPELPTKPFRNVVSERDLLREEDPSCASAPPRSPASSSRLTTSCGATQLRSGLRGFRRSSSASLIDRSPDAAVRVDDDPRALGASARATRSKSVEQVVHVRHEVGEDDVVERLAELELLAGDALEAELADARSRARSTISLRDVDADADARLQRGEQVARARSRSRARARPRARGTASAGRSAGDTCCSGASSGTPRSRTGRRTPPALRRGPPSRARAGRLRWPPCIPHTEYDEARAHKKQSNGVFDLLPSLIPIEHMLPPNHSSMT